MTTKNNNRIRTQNWVTVVSEITEMDEIEGIESLVYYVSNRPDIDAWDELGSKMFRNQEKAYNYAYWLHNKFNTQDIVENWG